MDDPQRTLSAYRTRIDAIDDMIAQLLVERMGVIGQVAALKAQHWPGTCHIRPGREGQMHRAVAARFAGTGFPPLAGLAIWRQLIGASTHLESPLNVAFLAAYDTHRWLAREYFGVQIGLHAAPSLTEALAHIATGKINLLILPTPRAGDWWCDAAAIRAAGLSIFAQLPVAMDGSHSALALAAVTPEDSGEDVSYFAVDGKCVTVNGFTTTHANGTFLGAHPRAVDLGD